MSVLHVHAFGPESAPPVLVLHGVTNTGRRYRRLAEEHLPGVRVLAVDLRGHNRSTWDPPWDVGQHVADVLDTLDDAGIARLPVVGHSFGGVIGAHLAAVAPERVASLVLLDPAGALGAARVLEAAESTRTDDGWASRDEARALRLSLRPAHSRDTVDEDLDTFLEEGPDGRWRLRFSRPAAITAWSEMARAAPSLAGYPGRVVLATALQDPYVTDAFRAALVRDLGDRLEQVGIDAGHALFWDAPAEVAGLVRREVAA